MVQTNLSELVSDYYQAWDEFAETIVEHPEYESHEDKIVSFLGTKDRGVQASYKAAVSCLMSYLTSSDEPIDDITLSFSKLTCSYLELNKLMPNN